MKYFWIGVAFLTGYGFPRSINLMALDAHVNWSIPDEPGTRLILGFLFGLTAVFYFINRRQSSL